MLKKMFFAVLSILLLLPCLNAKEIPVKMFGKPKAAIKMINKDGIDYIDALRLSKTLKLQTTWFNRSGQLNIKGPENFLCILRSGQPNAVINGENYPLKGNIFMDGGSLYVPLSFFTSGKISSYIGYNISFEDGTLVIEKIYNLSREDFKENTAQADLIFKKNGQIKVNKTNRGRYFAELSFSGAVIKREETLTPQSQFIENIKIRQNGEDVSVSIQLKGKGHEWLVFEEGSYIAFCAGETEPSSPLAVYLLGDNAAGKSSQTQTEQIVLTKPSVLEQADDIVLLQEDLLQADAGNQEEDITELGDEFFAAQPVISKPNTQNRQTAAKKTSEPKGTVVNKLVTSNELAELKKAKADKNKKFRVLIDPGHGGKDSGAVRKGSSKEKDINLAVGKALYDLLKKEKNFEVKITRDSDVFITLGDRATMGNEWKADAFVSIHSNAAKRPSANGFEVYFRSDKASDAEAAETAALENEAIQYEGKTGGNISFADLLLKSLATNENINQSSKLAAQIRNSTNKKSSSIGIKVYQNSAIKQANFYVLRGVHSAAVLVEMGYLSNANDKKKLNTKNIRSKIAECIRDGIVSYAKAEGWK